ncbi:MAG: S1C family serine protease [bacterium]
MQGKVPKFILIFFSGMYALLLVTACRSGRQAREKHIADTADVKSLESAFEVAVEKIRPSVVGILSESDLPMSPWEAFREDFFERFFKGSPFEELFRQVIPPGPKQEGKQITQGSGIVLDKEGHILTNNHIIAGSKKITVSLHDKSEYKGEILGSDPNVDLAVIKIQAEELQPIVMGDSHHVRLGQWVIAVGSPFGREPVLTVGVVSAKPGSRSGTGTYEDFLQTDASIYQGNTGGPLINLEGKVVGINAMILQPGQGIGFAVPVNRAKEVARKLIIQGKSDQIITRQEPDKPWIGIGVQDLTPELREAFGLHRDTQGVLINEVFPDSPAEKVQMLRGDIIIRIDGEPVKAAHDVVRKIAAKEPEQKIKLMVIRSGQEKEFILSSSRRSSRLFR